MVDTKIAEPQEVKEETQHLTAEDLQALIIQEAQKMLANEKHVEERDRVYNEFVAAQEAKKHAPIITAIPIPKSKGSIDTKTIAISVLLSIIVNWTFVLLLFLIIKSSP